MTTPYAQLVRDFVGSRQPPSARTMAAIDPSGR